MITHTRQTEAWVNEYEKLIGLPTSTQGSVSGKVEEFLAFLKKQGINIGNILDIGCGLGRNSFYLARQGYKTWAFDIVPSAIEHVATEAKNANLPINVLLQSAAEPWQYQDGFFDAAIDICVFDNMVTAEMKHTYINELHRTLKPGAYFLLFAILAEDEYYAHLLQTSEHKDQYILHDPQNNLWSSMLPSSDLLKLFSQKFTLIEEKEIKKQGELMYGKMCERRLTKMIFQKPNLKNTL